MCLAKSITRFADLLRGAAQFGQAVLQTHGARHELVVLGRQQVLVELDLLEEALGSRVVVATLVDEVRVAHLVNALVHGGHEVCYRDARLLLKRKS